MFFDRLDEMNAMVKSVSHFDNFTKYTFLVVNTPTWRRARVYGFGAFGRGLDVGSVAA